MGRLHHPANKICIFLSWSRSKGVLIERAETKELSGLRLLGMQLVEIGTAKSETAAEQDQRVWSSE